MERKSFFSRESLLNTFGMILLVWFMVMSGFTPFMPAISSPAVGLMEWAIPAAAILILCDKSGKSPMNWGIVFWKMLMIAAVIFTMSAKTYALFESKPLYYVIGFGMASFIFFVMRKLSMSPLSASQ